MSRVFCFILFSNCLDLKDKMDQLVGEINGRFSTPRWSPIRYIFGCINQVRAVNVFVIFASYIYVFAFQINKTFVIIL